MWPERATRFSPGWGVVPLRGPWARWRATSSSTVPSPRALPREERMTLRVLVVDDHPAFRRALTSALNMVDNIEVAGEAGGGRDATRQAPPAEPDIAIMDLSMPDISSADA